MRREGAGKITGTPVAGKGDFSVTQAGDEPGRSIYRLLGVRRPCRSVQLLCLWESVVFCHGSVFGSALPGGQRLNSLGAIV